MQKPERQLRQDLQPALVFLTGELIAVPIPLERDEVILGRALEADVRVNDVKVSRQHARIRTMKDEATGRSEYVIADLESRNGVQVNGKRVSEAVLANGDKITIGEHILRFELLDEIDREYQKQIHRLITHDDLTGLLSSRSFFSELRREAAKSASEGKPLCVLVMDVDHFKKVNDTYGHPVGDQVLVQIANTVRREVRNEDVFARYGGEEFALVLRGIDIVGAKAVGERLRLKVSQFRIPIEQGEFGVTISVGCASLATLSDQTPESLILVSDQRLYAAKRGGRNRVVAGDEG
jgi:diguanylate cyclase (GGDEF)-like protein